MRPQHITAENNRCALNTVPADDASMRPQHITAENAASPGAGDAPGVASMRPQHITAENAASEPWVSVRLSASMRPQHITAENPPAPASRHTSSAGFNEAAAYHCGKHTLSGAAPPRPHCFNEAAAYHCGKQPREIQVGVQHGLASMRPQHITAENQLHPRPPDLARRASMRPQHITAENGPLARRCVGRV